MVAEATRRRELPVLDDVPLLPDRWMWFGRLVVSLRFRRYDVHLHGIDRIPAAGPVILASNHIGYPDGPLLFVSAKRRIHSMVKESMFTGPVGYGLLKMGQINVDRFHVDPRAVKSALRLLRSGRVVGIFPEGARGRGDVSVTKSGAAYLALVTGAPVVLVALLGTRQDGASTEGWPPKGTRMDIVVGETLRFDPVPWPRTKERVAHAQAEIQRALAVHVEQACALTGQTLPAPPPMPTSPPEE
jgi:1-acyl-sn-glycerol-3-phosphate acyltransferase